MHSFSHLLLLINMAHSPFSKSIGNMVAKAVLLIYESSWSTTSAQNPAVAAQRSKSKNVNGDLHDLSTQLPL